MKIVGYGICGPNEKYLQETLDCFTKLCDETIILGNNLTDEDKIRLKNFIVVEDNREWGKNQHRIKEDFLKNHVSKLDPDFTLCLDMDEELLVTRETLEDCATKGQAWYVYVVNLWEKGYRSDWSFWNVRFWGWEWKDKLGEGFYKFENRPLHCGLAPKWAYHLNLHAPFILLHKGLKDKADRDRKVKRYEEYDPNQVYRASSYYEALKTDNYEEYNQEKIQKQLNTHINSMVQPLNKQLNIKAKKKEYLILREEDGFTFTIPENVLDTQLKQKYKGKGFKLI